MEAESLTRLHKILFEDKLSAGDFLVSLRSDSTIKLALDLFLLLLKRAVSPIEPPDSNAPDDLSRLRFQSWTDSQIRSLFSLGLAITSVSRSFSVEQAEPIVVSILRELLEFGVAYLEKSNLSSSDLSTESDVVMIMELALADGTDKAYDKLQFCSANTLLELLPVVSHDGCVTDLDSHIQCSIQDELSFSGAEKLMDHLVMQLASECIKPDWQDAGSSRPSQPLNNLIFLCQQWAVTHVNYFERMLSFWRKLIRCSDLFDEKVVGSDVSNRLSFCLRIVKLLRNLALDIPYFEYNATLLHEFAACADVLPEMFSCGFEFANNYGHVEGTVENLILLLLEEFLRVVQIVFCNSNVLPNIQMCVVASILDKLDASIWRYNKSASYIKPPLVYFPQTVLTILKLIQDVKKQRNQAFDEKKLDSINVPDDYYSCHVHHEIVPLLKQFSVDELLGIIFAPTQWLDNFMHLLFFLYNEGVKLRPKVERSHSSCSKSNCALEVESSVCHEDEALFGNLFYEGGRTVASTDAHDQPSVAVNSFPSNCNLPMQAAVEVLSFLKECVFSKEYSLVLFKDACNRLTDNHVDILLSLLSFQGGCAEYKSSDSSTSFSEEKRIWHIHDLVLGLLHNLSTHGALSNSLEAHLVEQILRVEDGAFTYNDHMLTLLALDLFSNVGLSGYQLRSKLFRNFLGFVVDKAKSICATTPNTKECVESLPSVFHVQILLMAFHLASVEEKAMLANLVFSSLKTVDAPSTTCSTQLSCWALFVSRLILVLRHMILYPQACPTSLLLHLRSKLRVVPASPPLPPNSMNDQFLSWASVASKNILGDCVEGEAMISSLINQLIEISAHPPLLCRRELSIESLRLSWDDMCTTLFWILGFWKGQKAAAVEDLIVERYMFMLCGDMPCMSSAVRHWLSSSIDSHCLDTSDMACFLSFSHALVGHYDEISKDMDYSGVLIGVLQQLCSMDVPDNIREVGWDFLRKGMWLSLVISLLNVGIGSYCSKNNIPGDSVFWNEKTVTGPHFIIIAESLTSHLIETDQVAILLRVLSSLLNVYLRVYQNAFLCTLGGQSMPDKHLSLLKHTSFEREELLKKNGASSCLVESFFDLLPRLDAFVSKRATDIQCKIFWEFALHGFPSHIQTPSAIFLSCIHSIRGIVSLLDRLLCVKVLVENVEVDSEVYQRILDSMMAIKFDRIFEDIQVKCDHIVCNLNIGFELSDCADLYLTKQMEEILREIIVGEVIDSDIIELVINKTIDTVDNLKSNPIKSMTFKYYLGAEDVSVRGKELCLLEKGDLMVLIDSLDGCYSELVTEKVLVLFVDLLSGEFCTYVKPKLQEKILQMDVLHLSKWLEKRLLGCVVETSGGVNSGRGNSASLRETTMSFLSSLISTSEAHITELQNHLFEAVLSLLDTAFLLFDISISKPYFHLLVQLCGGENSTKLLLDQMVMLMEKLAGNECLLTGLKFLFGFLGTLLNDCGSCKSNPDKFSGKAAFGNNYGVNYIPLKPTGSRKNSETLVISGNQDGDSTTLECDATSVDDEEDDGTSDGEVASMDKDDEEDTNSERALASKVCTFTSSGSNFMEQHWYFCYTCDLTVSKGCCSVCAKVCHRGHRVVYSRLSRFFCDCGAGGVRGSNCQCLKPRKFTGTESTPNSSGNILQPFLPLSEDADQLPESDSDLDDDVTTDSDLRLSIPRELQDRMPVLLEELDVENRVLQLCSSLLPSIITKREASLSKDKTVILGKDKLLSYGVELLVLKKAYKSGSLDLKIKADYSNAKELRSHLASGSLVKSLLSVNGRGRLAVGEGDKVAIFDVGQLISQATVAPVTADKTNVKPLSRNVVRFEIVSLTFNPVVESYLAVAGYEDCQVLTLNPRGEVTDRLAIELALQGAYIRRVDWVPGSQVKLMVVTNRFIKIYDLSQDNISPLHYFTLPNDSIVDATLLLASQGKMFLLVLAEQGSLFRLELSVEGNVGATPLKDVVQIRDTEITAKGSSLYFSTTYKLLFLSYQDGTTLMGRLSHDARSLSEISFVHEEEQDFKTRSAGLHHWKELLSGSGLFACLSTVKLNSAFVISMEANDLRAQNLKHALSSTSHLVGLTAYKPLSKDKIHCLVLHDDGSLQIYAHIPAGADANVGVAAVKVKKLGSGILDNKAYAGTKPEFPLDFFEKTVCITSDVKLGGDVIRNGDSEGAKQSLASEDGFLESSSPAGFKITVSNSNPDMVMVGFRVFVGHASANHIPSEITIFQRSIKLDEGIQSWYDIPFTTAESLLADEEFVISVGPTFSGTTLPRIDSLEVYGRAKDEFGWKEKMDAVLDMEARVLGNSLLSGPVKKCQSVQSTLQEQVVADGLKLLSRLYSLHKAQEDDKTAEPSELKCRLMLEKVFESDRAPLLQAAACCVLQAVFPKKERYYQVKDNMRLHGVVKSTSVLLSRLGVGGTTRGWVVEEFTAQMRAVSKIALHRRANLAAFLEINGSDVVDGLMQVLWGILDLEQPDTQTMNNIVVSSVELIYFYAECLALHGKGSVEKSVAPAVALFKKLLFFPNEAVQSSSSLAISSRLLQVPFPKQTILATDDSTESATSASGTTEAASGNTQVMIEEDTSNSSVQYCCDGCSTVPILRRRWHCTVCPDFDLCEACYQVLDADRLPPPHSREHPMTAIPIEVESFGDGNENHLSVDANDSSMLPTTADVSMQNSTPIHVLEPSESGDFSTSVTDSVSISASKQAVNYLLLSELLKQLKGWMGTTSGVRAIPIMQLFYRLSSAVGGPFINSSKPETLDLEILIKWFLDEIDLNRPFVARSRTTFGEVAILIFMFFTLMLRNWHHPGTESSGSKPSGDTDNHDKNNIQVTSAVTLSSMDDQEKNDFTSQLLRASSSLRNQTFVNYLLDILQQLVQVFKSPAVNFEATNSGSGCGALLTVRRDLPAGNFSPFFSDSYAKAHRSDIFLDYHRLLLENVFRLLYTLVRPEKQDKSGEKEKVYKVATSKDLKLDGYQEVLCSYINNPHTSFVRRYARRLFLHLCGSKTHYYSVRDSWQFLTEVKKLYKHINKSGGLLNPVPYERSVKIVKCLSTMAEVAASRPRNWQKYCLRHGDVLPFLMNIVFYFCEESVIQTLKLLNLAFYSGKDVGHSLQKFESGDSGTSSNKLGLQSVDSKKKKKGEDGTESGAEKSYLDMEAATVIFTDKGGDVLRQFVDCFLLEWNSSSVRGEAKCVLYGACHHGKSSFKETMLTALLQKVKILPMFGQNIVEFTELVCLLLGKVPDSGPKQHSSELVDRCLTPDVVKCIFETLHSQNELIANHPNSRIYNTLSGLVEFDGYYLESEPCVTCSSPEVPYSRMKLESLKSETKFTDNRIIVKCTGSYTIQTVTMNVHEARKSKSVKVLNLYYNNRPVADLSELKNNWSLWKRAKSCHLAFNQTELKVEFPIPITACNFMIELDSFYENLQALSLEPLQCPRCSRPVTDKHGICGNCHENAYQCRQCRNINYENLDSFLCNECGYSKYGRFEFNFMAKPSFTFDDMENDEDMKKGLAAIESESENAHRRYQQLLGFKKPLLKIVSSIGENDMDSQQKDSFQQMMVSLPGPPCKINRKITLLGVLYGEKCKAAFDSVSKSVQTLQGLRQVLMSYLHRKHSDDAAAKSRLVVSRSPNNCYGCATTFVSQCLEILHVLSKHLNSKKQLVVAGILSELFENNIHQGPKASRVQARAVLCAFSEGDLNAVTELNNLLHRKVMYCLEHHRSMDIALATHEELLLLSEVSSLADEYWESRLRVVFQLLFSSIKLGAKHPSIAEHIILPCLRIVSQACTPPKPDTLDKQQDTSKSASTSLKDDNTAATPESMSGIADSGTSTTEPLERSWDVSSNKPQDIQLVSYSEWEKGASYLDFVRRQYKVSQAVKGSAQRPRAQRHEYLSLKYGLRWKRLACKTSKGGLSSFELGSWVTELVLSACSQFIRSEMCMLINLLCAQSASRRFRLLNLLMGLLPSTLTAGESAAEYFELLFKMIESEDARLFLTVRGALNTICKLITQEVGIVKSLERSLHIDISQGFILHKLIELLGKFLEVPNIRSRFMQNNLLSDVLEALIVIRGLIVQKTKLICDCNRLLKDLLDGLLLENNESKRQFIRACINGLQIHGQEKKGRTCLFILEQLCNLICPSKPESVYLLVLNKALTQEEYIRGSMTKNPYSSAEIGPLMRDVKNKICRQLDLLCFLEGDYGMELLVAGNIISLDLSIAQVYEQVWKKSNMQSSNTMANSAILSSNTVTSARDSSPMTITYRLQGLDGEATEPMIKELEEDREESQDPEIEFAIAGAVREYGGLEVILGMIQRLRDDFKSNQELLVAVLNLLKLCCKIKENRQALLRLGALGLLLETARRAFSVDAMEPAEGILLIVESLTLEANESDNINIAQTALAVSNEETGAGEQAKKIVLMFLERLSQPLGLKMSNKQQRNMEMVARILPYLTYGEPAAMEALIQHFNPYLQDWKEFDQLQKEELDNPASKQRFTVDNFVRVSESLKTSSCGERLKDIILEKGIADVAVRHLKESFPCTEQDGIKLTAEWSLGLKLPSVPYILSLLRGLAMGHLATQKSIDDGGILPLLHALEGVPGENEIGAKAENLLDTLSNKDGNGDGFLEEKVSKLRSATRDEKRRRALRRREELLQGLGMRQEVAPDGGERIVVSQPALEGLEDVEEEDGLACMVCREGYSLRPSDLLGVYSFSKRVNLGVNTLGSGRGEWVYTTVSYFNIIHYQCHQEAKRADAALRNPKKEWEGAALRNNECLCNSLFPIRGPSVPLAQYVRYVDQYWDNLNALGRADGSRLRLLTYDIVLMLARFATGASFSYESRGGGPESNSRFLPFMIQMACHLLEQGSSSQRHSMAKTVSSYITSSSDSRSSNPSTQLPAGTEETVQFMMVNSLLSESYESWLQHRRTFLQRGIYHAYMQHKHGRSRTSSTSTGTAKPESGSSNSNSAAETDSPDDLLSIVRPMLVYTGLIQQLQHFFKVKKSAGASSTRAEGTSSGSGKDDNGLEAWEAILKERLLNIREMVGLSKELLSWLDEMNSATDLQEAFDIIGVLSDVLSGGIARCEDFVHAAINAGKN